jgi:hypothetical protein
MMNKSFNISRLKNENQATRKPEAGAPYRSSKPPHQSYSTNYDFAQTSSGMKRRSLGETKDSNPHANAFSSDCSEL